MVPPSPGKKVHVFNAFQKGVGGTGLNARVREPRGRRPPGAGRPAGLRHPGALSYRPVTFARP